MAEQFLDDPEVGAPVEEVGGEAVAEGVGMGGDGRAAVEDPADVPRIRGGCPAR